MHHLVVTWNIHGAVGWDRRRDPRRVAAVLREINADIVGLQEVDTRHRLDGRSCPLEGIAAEAGYYAVAGPTMLARHGHYGNAVLTRHRPRAVRHIDLSVGRHEPRCALDVDIQLEGGERRVVVTHLGLRARERAQQIERLLTALDDGRDTPLLVLGDMNEWRPASRLLARLDERFGASHAVRTFPSLRPVVALDRIWASPRGGLSDVRIHATPLARRASDHLPVRGRLFSDAPAPALTGEVELALARAPSRPIAAVTRAARSALRKAPLQTTADLSPRWRRGANGP